MRPESRRRPRVVAPRPEGLESLVLLNSDPLTGTLSAPVSEVSRTDPPVETTADTQLPQDLIVSIFSDEEQTGSKSLMYATTANPEPTPPLPDEPAATEPGNPGTTEPPAVEPLPVAETPTEPISDPLPPPAPMPTPISVPVTPAPRIEVAPSVDNLRIDLSVERTSPFAGRTIRFHTRETNVGGQTIRLEPLSNFDVVVSQNGEVVWRLTDVRRARAALLPSQSFEPLASRGVSVWWDGYRSRGGRGPVTGDVEVFSTMDGVQSAPQTFSIQPNPVNVPRPAPQPVRVELQPTTPAPVLPPLVPPPVPAGQPSAGAPATPTPPPVLPPTSPLTPPASQPTAPPAAPAENTAAPPAAPPATPAPPTQPTQAEGPRGRLRRWNTQIYGTAGKAWQQRRLQLPRPAVRPTAVVQENLRQIRLARLNAMANRWK